MRVMRTPREEHTPSEEPITENAAEKAVTAPIVESEPVDRFEAEPVMPEGDEDDEMNFAPKPSVDTTRLRAFIQLSAGFRTWAPASTVLTTVRSVKTIFIQYNQATRIKGHPLERFGLVHGPSGHGKTAFVLGLGLSFLQQGHIFGLVDAEYTTPIDWCRELMGTYAESPAFVAMRPSSYEETVDAVDQLLERLVKARDSKGDDKLPDDTSCLLVVDSLKKLIPVDIWTKIMKVDAAKRGGSDKDEKKGSVDGMSGRMAQLQAAMNAAWMNRLTPLLYKTGTTMVAIARESENIGHQPGEADWKVQGGGAIIFDSSLVNRVVFGGYVMQGETVVGERHRIIVRKSKVAGKEAKGAVCYFHTSNGVLIPPGFDTARDVLELARRFKIVTDSGTWRSWKSWRCQGDHSFVKKLHFNPEMLADLQADVESRFTGNEELQTETAEDLLEASFE